jgi:Tfp pilus assembly protein PilX
MMKMCRGQKGIALVMALIIAVVVLAAVSALIYLVTIGTSMSGFQKRYQTAQEAAKGGLELVTKEIVPRTISKAELSADLSSMKGSIATDYSTVSLSFPATTSTACLQNKLLDSTWIGTTNNWTSCGAANMSLNPAEAPDITFRLAGNPGAADFNVLVKIVDTVAGNTDISGLDLQGMGVVETGSGMVTPKQNPYMYRLEIRAERTTNPDERANLSVLFAY